MKLEQKLQQTQTLSPQTIQRLEILQKNTLELADYVKEAALENPVLEIELPEAFVPARGREQGRMEWLESNDAQNRWYHRQDDEGDERNRIPDRQGQSLKEYIRSQLPAQSKALERATEYLLESLDANGWISESLEQLSQESAIPLALLERALAQIQNAEPWGVGARDLRECLLIQLYRRPDADDIAAKIVRDYLPELAKNHFNLIARELQISQERVRQAAEQIKLLNPRPANGFSYAEPTNYIIPDMVAKWNGEGFDLRLSEAGSVRLNISSYYIQMQKESHDAEVIAYLDQKVRQAQWLVTAVGQRRETMLRCMQVIMELQPEYFQNEKGTLRPMTLGDVASRLGIHESTVSRAIRGKYIQCPDGVVPLSFFFSRAAFGGEDGRDAASGQEVKDRLRALLKKEDPHKPYSDQKLAELLEEEGYSVSRRTVAKYRGEMGVPPATGRKKT